MNIKNVLAINVLEEKFYGLILSKLMFSITDDELIEFIDNLCPYWYNTQRFLEEKIWKKDLDKFHYEWNIWQLGEKIRQCLQKQNRERCECLLLDRAIEILHTKEYRHGRVSFGFLFEDYAVSGYGIQIKDLLLDDDVQLQQTLLDAVRKMKSLDAEAEVRQLLAVSPHSWIRKKCESYLKMTQKYRNKK